MDLLPDVILDGLGLEFAEFDKVSHIQYTI